VKTWLFIIGLLTVVPTIAQHSHRDVPREPHAHARVPQGSSPYAGMQSRAIKALSEQQVADLRAGKGMSLALPAELNGYPGPSHTLEMGEPLGLSEEQKLKTQSLFKQMQAETKALGEQVISSEYELDRLFKDRTATPAAIDEATARAGQVQGQLRASHLKYHLNMVDVLTPEQVAKYNQIRGY
jgi:Spy/CpxP family protein refolding chaperone